MVTEKDLLEAIHGIKDVRSIGLSYRRYGRLNEKQKNKFDKLRSLEKYKYHGEALGILLYYTYKGLLNISRGSMEIILGNLTKIKRRMLDIQLNGSSFITKHWLTKNIEKKVTRQFLFLGFVPLNEFRLRHGYAYMSSSRSLDGVTYIYPMRLVDDYRKMRPGYFQWQQIFENNGIPGYTRIWYSHEYKYLKRNQK